MTVGIVGNFVVPNSTRWLYPIGPAPKGWQTISGCSRTIPHDEGNEWENDDMNKDHYV